MSQKGYFFNALPDTEFQTGYDRNYSADDFSNWLQAVITTGVIKTNNTPNTDESNSLKVVATTGLNIQVQTGLACINGKPYINDSILPFTLDIAPVGEDNRYDLLILQLDNRQVKEGRKTEVIKRSIDHIPTIADLQRTSEYYELLLGYVTVQPNATTILQTDITDTRGDTILCPWTSAVKGYADYYDAIVQRFEDIEIVAVSTNRVTTDLISANYNSKYSLVDVYINGLKESEGNYTIDATNTYLTINFDTTINAGAEILVVINNFLDGEGLSNVLQDYTQWVAEVTRLRTLNDYNYYCNGTTDNVEISNLIKDFIDANRNEPQRTFTLHIIGTFGATAAANGNGSQANPYKWFNLATGLTTKHRFLLDFSNCTEIDLPIPNATYNYIFSGDYIFIKNAIINAKNTNPNTSIVGFNPLVINFSKGNRAENCIFNLEGFVHTYIAQHGYFKNCKGTLKTDASNNCYCFFTNSNANTIRIEGGDYTITQGNETALVKVNTGSSEPVALIIGTSYRKADNTPTASNSYSCIGAGVAIGLITAETNSGFTMIGTLNIDNNENSW